MRKAMLVCEQGAVPASAIQKKNTALTTEKQSIKTFSF